MFHFIKMTPSSTIKILEKLSLLSASKDVIQLFERSLSNVQPILKLNIKDVEPLIWQTELDFARLHQDVPKTRLDLSNISKNASNMMEDYVVVGPQKARCDE